MSKSKKNVTWAEAKKRCRLNQTDIKMAKELGMKPNSLLKNIPSPNQKWKAPVKVWFVSYMRKNLAEYLRLIKKINHPKKNMNFRMRSCLSNDINYKTVVRIRN